MVDSFVGQSAGDGKRATAALASKHALVNEKGRVDVIPCARWDTLNWWYVFHPSIPCSVGQLISPFLSQARSTAT